jgi:hypothetical protein
MINLNVKPKAKYNNITQRHRPRSIEGKWENTGIEFL